MNVRILIVSLLAFLIVLGMGFGLGVLYKTLSNPSSNNVPVEKMPESVKILSSQVVTSINAAGKVTKVDGKNVTLLYGADSRTIKIHNNAIVNKLVVTPVTPTNKSSYALRLATFEDIKVDDNLEVVLKVWLNGQVEGMRVTILPAPTS